MTSRTKSMAEAIKEAQKKILEDHEEALILGVDLAEYGGPFRATSGLFEIFGESRFVDAPLHGRLILGMAKGLILGGQSVICEYPPEFSASFFSLFESELQNFQGHLILRMPYGHLDGEDPKLGRFDFPFLGEDSPWEVCVSHDADAAYRNLLRAAKRKDGPSFILEPKSLYRLSTIDGPEDSALLGPEADANDGLEEEAELCLLSWGAENAYTAALQGRLREEGRKVRHLALEQLFPLPMEVLISAIKASGRLLLVTDAMESYGARLLSHVMEACFFYWEAPPRLLLRKGEQMDAWLQRGVQESLDLIHFE